MGRRRERSAECAWDDAMFLPEIPRLESRCARFLYSVMRLLLRCSVWQIIPTHVDVMAGRPRKPIENRKSKKKERWSVWPFASATIPFSLIKLVRTGERLGRREWESMLELRRTAQVSTTSAEVQGKRTRKWLRKSWECFRNYLREESALDGAKAASPRLRMNFNFVELAKFSLRTAAKNRCFAGANETSEFQFKFLLEWAASSPFREWCNGFGCETMRWRNEIWLWHIILLVGATLSHPLALDSIIILIR